MIEIERITVNVVGSSQFVECRNLPIRRESGVGRQQLQPCGEEILPGGALELGVNIMTNEEEHDGDGAAFPGRARLYSDLS